MKEREREREGELERRNLEKKAIKFIQEISFGLRSIFLDN